MTRKRPKGTGEPVESVSFKKTMAIPSGFYFPRDGVRPQTHLVAGPFQSFHFKPRLGVDVVGFKRQSRQPAREVLFPIFLASERFEGDATFRRKGLALQ